MGPGHSSRYRALPPIGSGSNRLTHDELGSHQIEHSCPQKARRCKPSALIHPPETAPDRRPKTMAHPTRASLFLAVS